jgi:RNA polymerase sigma-70 factor, ECF subfamily
MGRGVKSDRDNAQERGVFDTRFFEVLVESHSDALYRFARSIVKDDDGADDIVQDVFLYVWKNRESVDMGRNIRSWLFSITYSRAIDHIRKHKKTTFFSALEVDQDEPFGADVADEELLADGLVDRQMNISLIQESLNTLSEGDRLLINLYVAEEMTFDEISQVLKQPLNTVKSRYRRLLIKLKQHLAPKYE